MFCFFSIIGSCTICRLSSTFSCESSVYHWRLTVDPSSTCPSLQAWIAMIADKLDATLSKSYNS